MKVLLCKCCKTINDKLGVNAKFCPVCGELLTGVAMEAIEVCEALGHEWRETTEERTIPGFCTMSGYSREVAEHIHCCTRCGRKGT